MERKLREDWSPEIIAEKLTIDYPNDDDMRVSHETIYRWIYGDARGGGTLYQHLRRRRKKRRRQKRYGSGRRFIPGRVSISERPAIVETRERLVAHKLNRFERFTINPPALPEVTEFRIDFCYKGVLMRSY